MTEGYTPGGDAKAIAEVARRRFGGFEAMFEHHGWPERGSDMMRKVQTRVVETYGSVAKFETAYGEGQLMSPLESIERDPPNVWLTSFDGFGPEEWGFIGFANEAHRARFLRETRPGVIVLIWASSRALRVDRGRIVGIVQCSHETGRALDFMPRTTHAAKQADAKTRDRWDFAVRIVRAWRIEPSHRRKIAEFAPKTYFTSAGTDRATFLGSQGDRLAPDEAAKLLQLTVEEVNVYGQPPVGSNARGLLEAVLKPSKPGPVSQMGYWSEPAEGPKHLYVLKLTGQASTFLNDASAHGSVIVKPGFSGDPQVRCAGLNAAFPASAAFRWIVHSSTGKAGLDPFPSSVEAKIGEAAMQGFICQAGGRSLGDEFFLISRHRVDDILDAGTTAAKAGS